MANGKMRDREFHTVQDIFGGLTEIWNAFTFKSRCQNATCAEKETDNQQQG
jgi:hypothetical protein